MGLVLEWVYGTIVSTAEKARDSAKKPLGEMPPLKPSHGSPCAMTTILPRLPLLHMPYCCHLQALPWHSQKHTDQGQFYAAVCFGKSRD